MSLVMPTTGARAFLVGECVAAVPRLCRGAEDALGDTAGGVLGLTVQAFAFSSLLSSTQPLQRVYARICHPNIHEEGTKQRYIITL